MARVRISILAASLEKLRLPTTLSVAWRALADRKIADLVALQQSGRLDIYYSQEQFFRALEEARRLKDEWDDVVRQEIAAASARNNAR
jgi:hypothetical protein